MKRNTKKINYVNSEFQSILNKIPKWQSALTHIKIKITHWYYKFIIIPIIGLKKYNYFKIRLKLLILFLYGYNVIAISKEYGEDIYFFDADDDAEHAFNKFDKKYEIIQGWFYGLNSKHFNDTVNHLHKNCCHITVFNEKYQKYFNYK